MLTYSFDFHFTSAIICRIASSLADVALSQRDIREIINIETARKQHQEYIVTLRLVFFSDFILSNISVYLENSA